jgi:hypothetical protein
MNAVAVPEKRAEILKIEKTISECPQAYFGDNERCPLFHSFADGVYVREIQIPAGELLVGKIHRHSHPNFLLHGKVTVITEEGGQETLTAPCYMISPAGTKRAVYVHEDCSWVTVHVTDETDLEKIEEYVIAKDYDDDALTANQVKALESLWLG